MDYQNKDHATQEIPTRYKVFDNLIEGAQVINEDLEYVYINKQAAKHGKSTQEELIGRKMVDMYPGIQHTKMFKHLERCLQLRKSYEMINEFEFPDKTKGYFELRFEPVTDGILILSFDISDRVKLEKGLKNKLEERTRLLNQIMEQKEQLEEFCHLFAQNMSAPLTNLKLLTDMMDESESIEDTYVLVEKQRKVLDVFQEAYNELIDVTQNTFEKEEVDLEKYLSDVKAELKNKGRE